VSELSDDHPELVAGDFDRLKEMFDWKSKKIKAIPA
jgi:hypothetical protein